MKKEILRLDLVTQKMTPSNQLIRIVKKKDGTIMVDKDKNINGRGVYLSPNVEGLNFVWKKRLIQRGLKTNVQPELYDEILKEIEQNWD